MVLCLGRARQDAPNSIMRVRMIADASETTRKQIDTNRPQARWDHIGCSRAIEVRRAQALAMAAERAACSPIAIAMTRCPCRSAGQSTAFDPLRSEEHTSELQSRENLVCRLLL